MHMDESNFTNNLEYETLKPQKVDIEKSYHTNYMVLASSNIILFSIDTNDEEIASK